MIQWAILGEDELLRQSIAKLAKNGERSIANRQQRERISIRCCSPEIMTV